MKHSPLEIISLAAILLVSLILGYSMFTVGHVWGDDFAAYILQAQSLLHGSTSEFISRNSFTLQNSSFQVGPEAYPWGFPALLTPIIAFIGPKITALKSINLVFYALFLISFYFFLRPRTGSLAGLILAAGLAFNPTLLLAQDQIQSDFVFLFLSTLTLFLIKQNTKPNTLLSGLIGVLIALAFSVRTNGILLLAALPFAHGLTLNAFRNWKQTAIPYLTAASGILINFILFPGGQSSYFSHYTDLFSLQRLIDNFFYYLNLPQVFFERIFLADLFYWVVSGLFVIGLWQRFKEELPIISYVFVSLAIFFSWPERQGLRFIYPLIPFYLYLAWEGGQVLLNRLNSSSRFLIFQQSGWVLLALLSLITSFQMAQPLFTYKEINGPYHETSQEMFAFIRENTPADAVIIFFKPRAMRLFTNRDSILTTYCEDLTNGDYYVLNAKGTDSNQINAEELMLCDNFSQLHEVFKNRRFVIYQVEDK